MQRCLLFVVLYTLNKRVITGKIHDDLLDRHVTSDQLLQRDENGECFVPPFCELEVSRCNIPRIPVSELSFDVFYNEYYLAQRPLIIEYGEHLSSVMDNSSGIFEWHRIISTVRSHADYQQLAEVEVRGTPRQRASTIDIHPLQEREPATYQHIIEHIEPPLVFQEIDILNELNGYLAHSDDAMMANKWVIFGTAGGGAHFHFDYYLSSFWNVVLSGSKFWLLTEPYDTLAVWNHSDDALKQVMALSINDFFADIYLSGFLDAQYQRINAADSNDNDNNENKDKQGSRHYYECVQRAGDVLYAPPIYYHATVNLERTLSVSRNMITRRNYQQSFNFLTQIISLRSMNDKGELVGIYQTMNLCAALYRFDEELFRSSACWTKAFLDRLNTFNQRILNKTYVTDYFKFHDKYYSQFYIDLCNYAKEHALFSSFRA